MTTNIALGFTQPEVTITIGEHNYALRPMTKKIEDELQPLSDAVSEMALDPLATSAARVEAMAKQLDVMLYSGVADTPLPSELIVKAYAENKTTRADVQQLCEDVVLQTRPT